MKMSMRDAKALGDKNEFDAYVEYRNLGEKLFDYVFVTIPGESNLWMVEYLTRQFNEYTSNLSKRQVSKTMFSDENIRCVEIALKMPNKILYARYGRKSGSHRSEWLPYLEECNKRECELVYAFKKAIYDYCKEAAYLARCVQSGTSKEWNFAYMTIECRCLSASTLNTTCTADEAERIGKTLRELPLILRADIETYDRAKREEKKQENATRPGKISLFKNHTLKRIDGSWIKVESDGCTFTCLARMGGGLKPRSFTMPNASQIKFMDALLDCFESRRWYKPATNKSQWGNKLFARGEAKDFLDAGYIINWDPAMGERELGGKRGAIRLEMLTERA